MKESQRCVFTKIMKLLKASKMTHLAFYNHINPYALKAVLQGSASNYVNISLLSLPSLSPNLCKECIHFEGNMFRVDRKTTEEFSWLLLLFTAFPKYYLMNTKHVHHKNRKGKQPKHII